MTGIIIYHNPACGTSTNTLALIRNAGVEPEVVEYLKAPPDREKETLYAELGLTDQRLSDAELIDAMLAHPVLINRPIVVTPRGVKLCRPSETVLDILPIARGGNPAG